MYGIPVIRLEVEQMKHSIVTALTNYAAQLDADIHRSVEKFCASDNIGRIIEEQVVKTLADVITEEVKQYFSYGEGRRAVAAAVEECFTRVHGRVQQDAKEDEEKP